MHYQILVLDLDGTLTNSQKEITAPTLKALFEIQEMGKKVVLASGRPINGVRPLAEQLHLQKYGGYMLSFNGARITNCASGEIVYNRTLPLDITQSIYDIVTSFDGLDMVTYDDDMILSGIQSNEYVEKESKINHMAIRPIEHFVEYVTTPVNKFLVTGDPEIVLLAEAALKKKFHSFLNIYKSEPYFLEIMPQNIDKAYSLQKLLSSIGLTADEMICCGDGFNDLTMIQYAGLGVAMENAQDLIKDHADYITKSNDEDGVLHVIRTFMQN
ncbi:MAG: Cof-type HAD-IIB family hydrolase [Hespellia sp.]|nr:Cof-type HAD-IIB family hydrolase [Hespellia sp.]